MRRVLRWFNHIFTLRAIPRILITAWVFVAYQIVTAPTFGVAGMISTITGIPGELYGAASIILCMLGVIGRQDKLRLSIATIPIAVHTMMSLLYNWFERDGNIFFLPFPTYFSIVLVLIVCVRSMDD